MEKHNVTAGVAAAGVGICVRKLSNKTPGSFGSLGLASGSGVSLPFFEMKDLLHFICGREEKRILKKRKEKKRKERKERKKEGNLPKGQRFLKRFIGTFPETNEWRRVILFEDIQIRKRKGKKEKKRERPKEE